MKKYRIVFNNGLERIILATGFEDVREHTILAFKNGFGEYWFWAPVKSIAYVEMVNEQVS